MNYSYAMGVDESILELVKYGFIVTKDDGDYKVEFAEDKSDIWENYIASKLKVGFWNEYISSQSNDIVFLFHLDNGIKRVVVSDYFDDDTLKLCEDLCGCKFGSIKSMIRNNHFYYEKVFKIAEIKEFLIRSKKNTYANGGSSKTKSTRLNSKDYEYSEVVDGHTYLYHDTYFGGEKFIGEEVVYVDGVAFWGMNYRGYNVTSLTEDAMDLALRPALMQVGADSSILPIRGPKEYKNGDFLYTFDCSSDFGNFEGVESIYEKHVLIYKLICNGGFIK